MAFFSIRKGQFSYFALQVGQSDWRGKDVLDFGGNVGRILEDPNSTIEEERYWCLDVEKDAVEAGRAGYPKAHWIHYDRYSFSFNPTGTKRLPIPDLGRQFDYVLAFSVFTNTTPSDMLDMVSQLEGFLSEDAALAFTFLDPFYVAPSGKSNLQWRLELERERKNISISEMNDIARRTPGAEWFMLVNGGDLYLESEGIKPYNPDEEKTCYVYHTEQFMRALFPGAAILPPVNNEMHHCCIIRNHKNGNGHPHAGAQSRLP